MRKRTGVIIVGVILAAWLATAVYAAPRVISMAQGERITIECNGGLTPPKLAPGIWNTITVTCPGGK